MMAKGGRLNKIVWNLCLVGVSWYNGCAAEEYSGPQPVRVVGPSRSWPVGGNVPRRPGTPELAGLNGKGMIWTSTPNFWDYFGYGENKIPVHRTATACPCARCRKNLMIGGALKAQSEAVGFVVRLKFIKYLAEKGEVNEEL